MMDREEKVALFKKDQIQIAIEEQEERDRKVRHSYPEVGIQSSMRILLGGFACGDVDEKTLRDALESLKEVHLTYFPDKGEVNLDIDGYIRESKADHAILSKGKGKALATILGNGRILLVDDEYEKFGWNIVFDAIFGHNHVEYKADPDEAKSFVKGYGDELSLVLLDLRLPTISTHTPHENVGLELLREIKKDHLDLPVVIFSGVDEVRYARKCFSAGAVNYFVKELEEKKSLQYYRKFKEVILDALSHPECRNIWRRIKKLPGPGEFSMGTRTYNEMKEYLFSAYYFLTTPENDSRVQLIHPEKNTTIYWACILQCALAVELVIKKQSKSNKGFHQKHPELAGIKKINSSRFGDKIKTLCNEGILTRQQGLLAEQVWKERTQQAHAPIRARHEKQAVKVFNIAIDFFESYFSRRK